MQNTISLKSVSFLLNQSLNLIGAALIILIITFLIFLILREVMCWYWKINQMVGLLEKINENLQSMRLNYSSDSAINTSDLLTTEEEICPFCKEKTSKQNKICEICHQRKR